MALPDARWTIPRFSVTAPNLQANIEVGAACGTSRRPEVIGPGDRTEATPVGISEHLPTVCFSNAGNASINRTGHGVNVRARCNLDGMDETEPATRLNRDFKQTVTERVQREPTFARALLDEAASLLDIGLDQPFGSSKATR